MSKVYYNINYYHNRFFVLNDNLFIYVYVINNKHIYDFYLNNNILFMNINGKKKNVLEKYHLNIIYNNKECHVYIKPTILNNIKIGNIHKLSFNNTYILNNFDEHFNIDYYIQNNKLLNNTYINNIQYINYHWLLCGRINPQLYYKYLIRKYRHIILKLPIHKLTYNINNNNTLLFIDNRYDPLFYYLLRLFIYSVDDTWNITIFTTENNKNLFINDLNSIGVDANIIILDTYTTFNNNIEYSNLLKNKAFWSQIKEDNCLLFQYDSFCMGKFDPIFYNYNYIGAKWPHKASNKYNINIGNGGTSFRKTRIMEKLIDINMNKINNNTNNTIEDVFFAELLYENDLYNCTEIIADKFSFENIFNNNSIYAHQIYNTVKLEDMDNFILNKLELM